MRRVRALGCGVHCAAVRFVLMLRLHHILSLSGLMYVYICGNMVMVMVVMSMRCNVGPGEAGRTPNTRDDFFWLVRCQYVLSLNDAEPVARTDTHRCVHIN